MADDVGQALREEVQRLRQDCETWRRAAARKDDECHELTRQRDRLVERVLELEKRPAAVPIDAALDAMEKALSKWRRP